MEKKYMTVREAASYLGYTTGTLYHKIRKGEVPYIKLGYNIRFRRKDLDEWMRNHSRRPGPTPGKRELVKALTKTAELLQAVKVPEGKVYKG